MSTISRDELHEKIHSGDRFTLFEVLPKMYWRKHHLPGAQSLPLDQVAELAPQLVPDKGAEIVLYCWDVTCPTSARAARDLAAMGYTNVREYAEGKQDWIAAGFPVTKN